ncbi:nucleotide pyrophosphohydrolase [Candidatus Woesearchaeota archaeon]|nr:nucleotide pyrophosphohydrolase [Candidatus Woesearchaeota archaeon]
MDGETTIQELKDKMQAFCEERDWDQFHGAKDLAIGVITEASEILEHFRFKSEEQIVELFANPDKKTAISEEMADVLILLARMAQKYDVDLSEAYRDKMAKNEKKYPVEKAKGSNKKYNEL